MSLGLDDLKTLLDALGHGIGLLDADGRFTYVNASLANLADGPGPVKGIEGKSFAEVFPSLEEDVDWPLAARDAIERGRTLRLARRPLRPDLHVDCTLKSVEVDGGCRALLTIVDVTEVVIGEARLLRQVRTQAIANFGDSVAHEIRNPLNSLHMNVQLLREWLDSGSHDKEQIDRTAATVQREIKRLDRVVRDFVQYSRPPALRLEAGSINHVARAALDLLDGQIREKRLKVEADLQSARPVLVDRDRLQRAIYNVILNAVQVLPDGGEIICRSRDEEHRCLLEVADNGPGLDPTKSARVFDLFYSTKPGGTGLGLPLANRIVEEHGGRMAVMSEPGRGATFAMFLPYDGPPAARDRGPTAVPRMPEGGGT
jgi:signal transduction histidine kinase